MGSSQSTSSTRAAKFSGNGANRRSVRAVRSAPATDPTHRRATSVRNTNRNVKEFSKFWSDAGSVNRAKSSTRQSTKRALNNANGNNGTVRRARTQSVDIRRASQVQCLPVPSASGSGIGSSSNTGTSNSNQRDRGPTQKRAASFRVSSSSQKAKQVHSSIRMPHPPNTPESYRSDIYSPDFNDAMIAAAHLRRLSLTPADHRQPYHSPHRPAPTSSPSPNSTSYSLQQNSPETAIY